MRRHKRLALVLALTLLVSILSGCGGGTTDAGNTGNNGGSGGDTGTTPPAVTDGSYNVDNMETLNLKVCTSAKTAALQNTPGYPMSLQYFADQVTERSGGKVTVTIYPDGQLGSSGDDMVTGATTGAFEFCTIGNGNFGEFTDAWMDLNLPFLFNSQEEVDAYLDGPRGDAIKEKVLEDVGVRVLSILDIGFRQTTSNKPIRTADDFKGLKIRTQTDVYQIATFEALGATTANISLSELFSALQQGVCDAQENPTVNIIQQKFYEVQDYVTLTAHNFGVTTICVGEDAFQSWSTDVQNLILEVAAETTEYCRQGLAGSTASDLEYLETVCEVYEPTAEEKQTFVDATSSIYDMVHEAVGDEWYNAIMSEVERIRG